MKTFKYGWVYFFSMVVIAVGLCGCGHERVETKEPAAVNVSELSEAALGKLAMADAHDGTVDHIVEDCASCKLHMKGKAEYAALVGGYTFHLCSPRCRQTILSDPEEVLARLEPDAEDGH